MAASKRGQLRGRAARNGILVLLGSVGAMAVVAAIAGWWPTAFVLFALGACSLSLHLHIRALARQVARGTQRVERLSAQQARMVKDAIRAQQGLGESLALLEGLLARSIENSAVAIRRAEQWEIGGAASSQSPNVREGVRRDG